MIALRGVHKSYRRPHADGEVLDGLDLEVARGEQVAVVGRSGCGKTTLLNIIGGLDTDYSGVVEVGGVRLDRLRDRELAAYRSSTAGSVFQTFQLLEHLTCLENAILPAAFARGPASERRQARERGLELLAEVGLAGKAAELAGTLSGGEKQRLALARALFGRPPLLLCDEVTGNLDEESARALVALLDGIRRQGAVSLLVATHDPLLERGADRVLRLADGRLHEVGR